jgi:hypothetical protein
MRLSLNTALAVVLGLASSSDALKILMGNDDGFGSGNLRELYKLLVDAGHEGKDFGQFHSVINAHVYQYLSLLRRSSSPEKVAPSSGPSQQPSRRRPSTTSFLQAHQQSAAIQVTTTSGTMMVPLLRVPL